MRGGEAGVQWQHHQALQTMCSRSTRTEQDDDRKKGPMQAVGDESPIKRTSVDLSWTIDGSSGKFLGESSCYRTSLVGAGGSPCRLVAGWERGVW